MTKPLVRARLAAQPHTVAGTVALIVAASGALVIAVATREPWAPTLDGVTWARSVLATGYGAAGIGGAAAGLALLLGERMLLLAVAAAGGLSGIGLSVTAVVQFLGAEGEPVRIPPIGTGVLTGVLGCVLVALGGLSALLVPRPPARR